MKGCLLETIWKVGFASFNLQPFCSIISVIEWTEKILFFFIHRSLISTFKGLSHVINLKTSNLNNRDFLRGKKYSVWCRYR